MAFRARLTEAVEDAIILGVKGAIIAALTLMGAGAVIGDYAITRAKAEHGEQAAQFIQKQLDAAKSQPQGAK